MGMKEQNGGLLFYLKASLKPSDEEVLALAERETDPELAAQFDPICRGPLLAMLALACVGLASLPAILVRLLKALLHWFRRTRSATHVQRP